MTLDLIITTSNDPFARGLDYLYAVRSLALDPDMIDQVYDLEQRVPICTWIGTHIEAINAQLVAHLQACHACFHAWEQPAVQVLAAPLASACGLDAFCNLQTHPISILVDVGRMLPQNWLYVVAHEYAHAHAGVPGHHQQFAQSLAHLCLGLGIVLPPYRPDMEDDLRFYPYYQPTSDPIAFWRGEGSDWQTVTNSYFPPESIG